MSHPYLIGSDIQGDLSGQIQKKSLFPQNDINRAFCSRRKGILTPLRITAVDHHVRMVHLQYFEIILILFMGITYDQYFIFLQFLFHQLQCLTSVTDLVLLFFCQLRRSLAEFRYVKNRIITESVLPFSSYPIRPSMVALVVSSLPSGSTAAMAQTNLAVRFSSGTPSSLWIRFAFFMEYGVSSPRYLAE